MKRLTETRTTADGVRQFRRIRDEHWLTFDAKASPMMTAIQRLAEYEDAEEQGRLVRLPCKVGDTVYDADSLIDREHVVVGTVRRISYHKPNVYPNLSLVEMEFGNDIVCANFSVFGNGIYLLRAEAEAYLQEHRYDR